MIVALLLPPVLQRIPEQTVMFCGAAPLLIGATGAIKLSMAAGPHLSEMSLVIWWLIGSGMSLILTPVGRVLRRSSAPSDRPAIFAAQFSLSHLCWLLTYPIAGWGASLLGFTTTWSILAGIATADAIAAIFAWPRHDPEEIAHTHDSATTSDDHLGHDATHLGDRVFEHVHTFMIDQDHLRRPEPTK
ncbi:H+ Antiporter protein [Mycobacteroides abscessus]|nr:H+ Antiporter protein [Mycobacteroides abscessus]CPU63416.1 H+ Antiporter protein [Mycobacteroides abscessus]SKK67491.1 H+ Antiporter protein [Mycobacteroides abscessus subsp. massiliense]SKQ44212.1 H+ Antiporter protein [Mycobacteroides abscessus subsp. massiliense]SKW98967.1 H+ Antiporter protein [Mycobacteroides abscessus subsp. massiliense]